MSTEQQPIVSVPQSIISDEVVDPPEKPVLKDPPVEEDSKTNGDETETNISDDEVSAEGGGESTPVEEEVVKEETPKSSQPGPYVYDPNKITLKFIFANRDGVKVILECKPEDTVGEVKGALLSMWPESEFIICAYHIMYDTSCVLLFETNIVLHFIIAPSI